MKVAEINYQVYVQCCQEIHIPDDIEITKEGYEGLVELREKIPEHEIWYLIPDNDANGALDIEDHFEFITGSGLDVPHCDVEIYSI